MMLAWVTQRQKSGYIWHVVTTFGIPNGLE